MTLQVELSDEQLVQIANLVAVKIRAGQATTYSKKEAAAVLGVSVKTIHRRIEAAIIPTIPNLGAVRIPAAFIDQLVNPHP